MGVERSRGIMRNELKEYIKGWFIKADNDLTIARMIFEHNPLILDIACFHCQQAVEKYLKAYIASKEKDIVKTHNLNFLQSQCVELDSDFKDFDFKRLGEFAVDARYPDDYIMPELSEAKEYLLIAEQVERIVKKKTVF